MTRRLLVWDAPNMDQRVGDIFDRRIGSADRPDLRVLWDWLHERADSDEVEACIFVNVPDPPRPGLTGWIDFLRQTGYRVFAKPKTNGSDIDDEMVIHIRLRVSEGNLREVIVASHDARNFAGP